MLKSSCWENQLRKLMIKKKVKLIQIKDSRRQKMQPKKLDLRIMRMKLFHEWWKTL